MVKKIHKNDLFFKLGIFKRSQNNIFVFYRMHYERQCFFLLWKIMGYKFTFIIKTYNHLV